MTVYMFSTGYTQQTVWPRAYCGTKARSRGLAWHELAMAKSDFVWQILNGLGFSRVDHPWRGIDGEIQERMVTAYLADDYCQGLVKEHLDEIGVVIRVFSSEVASDELRDALLEDLDEEALTEVIAVLAARRQA
jgi:hypothetical protein